MFGLLVNMQGQHAVMIDATHPKLPYHHLSIYFSSSHGDIIFLLFTSRAIYRVQDHDLGGLEVEESGK